MTTWTLCGTPHQVYYTTSGGNYRADIIGKIYNVSDSDMVELVRQGLWSPQLISLASLALWTSGDGTKVLYGDGAFKSLPTEAYAEITINGNRTPLLLPNANTYYQWEIGWTSDLSPSGASINTATGSITLNVATVLVTLCTINYSADATDGIRFNVCKNGVPVPDHLVAIDVLAANKAQNAVITGIDVAAAGDVYDLRIEDTTQGGTSVTIYNANFSVMTTPNLP